MSEKELDEILNELKKNSSHGGDGEIQKENENPLPEQEKQEKAQTSDDLSSQEDAADEVSDDGTQLTLSESEAPSQMTEQEEETQESSPDEQNGYVDINDTEPERKGGKKKVITVVTAIIVVVAVALGVYFGVFAKNEEEETTTSATTATQQEQTMQEETDTGVVNPLTGESGYNTSAVGKRPVAVVVENEYSTESVRPQWGLSDADMVLEGESEYSTRLLLFWADYTSLPDQIGPARSARPPFIRFSQLFDSVFIHAGLSHSKGDYVGADEVFESEDIDHINLLSEGSDYFARDKSRTSTIEHTGYLKGNNVPALLSEKDFDLDLDTSKFTQFEFNETAQAVGDKDADSVTFKWSQKCPAEREFTYDEDKQCYTTTDFDSQYGESNVQWTNLILLLDETEYIVKENYKGTGKSETYCDYALSGGDGMVLSQGTAIDVTWGVSDGKLWIKDESGNDVKLNTGKTYIGYGSSNNGGSITLG